jgi:hypothetical protein
VSARSFSIPLVLNLPRLICFRNASYTCVEGIFLNQIWNSLLLKSKFNPYAFIPITHISKLMPTILLYNSMFIFPHFYVWYFFYFMMKIVIEKNRCKFKDDLQIFSVLMFMKKSSFYSHAIILKLEFWTQDPHSWDSICQIQPPAPKRQIKRHGEGREKRFITRLRTWHGKKQSKHSVHL